MVRCCEQEEDAWRARLASATLRGAELELEHSRMSNIFSAAAEWRVTDEAATDKKLALEDVFWALLNSPEFIFNH